MGILQYRFCVPELRSIEPIVHTWPHASPNNSRCVPSYNNHIASQVFFDYYHKDPTIRVYNEFDDAQGPVALPALSLGPPESCEVTTSSCNICHRARYEDEEFVGETHVKLLERVHCGSSQIQSLLTLITALLLLPTTQYCVGVEFMLLL